MADLSRVQLLPRRVWNGRRTLIGFRPEDVIHFRLENPNEHVYGWSTLRAAAYEKNTADAIRVYESNWFKTRRVRLRHQRRNPAGTEGAGRLGATVGSHSHPSPGRETLRTPAVAAQGQRGQAHPVLAGRHAVLQLAQLTEDQILSIFKVPQFAVAKGQPFTTRASAVQASKEFAENAIEPRATLIWDTLNMRLINDPLQHPAPGWCSV